MKIKEMSYERVHNLGNYETERLGLIVTIDNEEPKELFEEMKQFTKDRLNIKDRPIKNYKKSKFHDEEDVYDPNE